MHGFRLSKSIATTTNTSTATSVTASRVSLPELAVGQRQQGSFANMSTTVYTPELAFIPSADQQFAGLRLLAEVSTSQIDPFEALATHRTITCDGDEDQKQSASSLTLSNELLKPANKPSQSVKGRVTRIKTTIGTPEREVLPLINDHFRRALSGTVPEALLTAIAGDPQLLTGHYISDERPNPADRWIVLTGDNKKRFKCGYEGCNKEYAKKMTLQAHLLKHTNYSRFRCYLGECKGETRYRDRYLLNRHIRTKHTFERPYRCNICNKRFGRREPLKSHVENVHLNKDEKKLQKRKEK